MASKVKELGVLEVAPDIYKPLFNNEFVRVYEGKFKPGAEAKTHWHPKHFVYVLESGKLRITGEDGIGQEMEMKIGDIMWLPEGKHSGINIGSSQFRILLVELIK